MSVGNAHIINVENDHDGVLKQKTAGVNNTMNEALCKECIEDIFKPQTRRDGKSLETFVELETHRSSEN